MPEQLTNLRSRAAEFDALLRQNFPGSDNVFLSALLKYEAHGLDRAALKELAAKAVDRCIRWPTRESISEGLAIRHRFGLDPKLETDMRNALRASGRR